MSVPGQTPGRRSQHGALRLRLGPVLQQSPLRVQPGQYRQPDKILEQVDHVGPGREDIPGLTGSSGGGRERIHSTRRVEGSDPSGHQEVAQVRRRDALVEVLRRQNRIQPGNQEECIARPTKPPCMINNAVFGRNGSRSKLTK